MQHHLARQLVQPRRRLGNLGGQREAELDRRRAGQLRCLRLSLKPGHGVEAGVNVLGGPRVGERPGVARAVLGTRPAPGPVRGEERLLGPATVRGVAAARREPACFDVDRQVRRQSGDAEERLRPVLVEAGDRVEERLGVGVAHRREELVGGGRLDDLARVHHHHAAGARRDHAHVVRDEEHGHVQALAQLVDQVEDLRLDRHVERRRRLVGDEELRLARERYGDHHALAEPAGKLVGVVVEALGRMGHPDELQDLERAIAGVLLRDLAVEPNPSAIWRPIVHVGLSDVIGSWKIIATSLPRTCCISRSDNGARSRPRRRTSPAVTCPTFGRSSSPTGRWSICRTRTRPRARRTRPPPR